MFQAVRLCGVRPQSVGQFVGVVRSDDHPGQGGQGRVDGLHRLSAQDRSFWTWTTGALMSLATHPWPASAAVPDWAARRAVSAVAQAAAKGRGEGRRP
ncbi:hypothetical protein STANM309S_00602 [Streptomyces tanashiensis]